MGFIKRSSVQLQEFCNSNSQINLSPKGVKSICRVALVLFIAISFSACQNMPNIIPGKEGKSEQKKDKKKSKKTKAGKASAPAVGADNFTPLPNPYLSQKVSVPGQAKKEFERVKAEIRAKRWKQAESLLILMTGTYPKLSGPFVNLGIVYREQKKFDKAEESFKKAISVNNANMDAYSQLGLLYREQGKFKEAESTYRAALKVWPHDPRINKNLGILLDLYMGKPQQALPYYKMVQRLQKTPDKKVQGWIVDIERRFKKK